MTRIDTNSSIVLVTKCVVQSDINTLSLGRHHPDEMCYVKKAGALRQKSEETLRGRGTSHGKRT